MVSRIKPASKPRPDRPPKTARRRVTGAQRLVDLLKFLTEREGATLTDIAANFGYSRFTGRTYAHILCDEGKAFCTVTTRHDGGIENHYHVGTPPPGVVTVVVMTNEFNRPTPKSYPLRHKRDLLVCAMFPVPAVLLAGAHP